MDDGFAIFDTKKSNVGDLVSELIYKIDLQVLNIKIEMIQEKIENKRYFEKFGRENREITFFQPLNRTLEKCFRIRLKV